MSDDRTDQGTVQIALRISPELRERIKAAAEENNRSVNKELTATLEERYPAPKSREAIMAALSEIMAAMFDSSAWDWGAYVRDIAEKHGLELSRLRYGIEDDHIFIAGYGAGMYMDLTDWHDNMADRYEIDELVPADLGREHLRE